MPYDQKKASASLDHWQTLTKNVFSGNKPLNHFFALFSLDFLALSCFYKVFAQKTLKKPILTFFWNA